MTSLFRLSVRVAAIACAALLCLVSAALAQYTDRQAIEDLGGPQEFAQRRTELVAQAKTGYTLLFARNDIPEAAHYREDNDFYYYTGVQDPGAVLAMDNSNGHIILFEPQQVGRTAQVYGPNLLSQADEAKRLGFAAVQPVGNLDIWLSNVLSAHPQVDLWVRLGFPDKADGARPEVGRDHAWKFAHPYHEDVPADLAPAKLLAQRYPMAKLCDLTAMIDAMRNIKRPKEIEVLRRNGKISADGNREAIAHAHPGMHQYEIEARAYEYYYSHGAQGVAYLAIVGSGKDINTWHYFSNREVIEPNQLVVFDFGASLDHLTMDITRTFNISGKFTPDQAKWYAVDLESQKATIALLKPGHTYEEAEAAGKAVFEKAGIAQQWYGFPGHFVGLATHDVLRPSGPIKAGQVVTVEPIVEFPDKQMHIRVEDTILITDAAPEILSSAIPKELPEVEKLVGSQATEKENRRGTIHSHFSKLRYRKQVTILIAEIVPEWYDVDGRKVFRPDSRRNNEFKPTFPAGRFVSQPLKHWCSDFPDFRRFLSGCKYVSDQEQFGQPDYWQPPEQFEDSKKGDCEDFALWAWRQLLHLNYPARFTVGRAGRYGEGHAWVTFQKDGKTYLLEPLSSAVGPKLPRLSIARYKPKFSMSWDGEKISYFQHEDRKISYSLKQITSLLGEWFFIWATFWVKLGISLTRRLTKRSAG